VQEPSRDTRILRCHLEGRARRDCSAMALWRCCLRSKRTPKHTPYHVITSLFIVASKEYETGVDV